MDADTGQPLAARLYLTDTQGQPFTVSSPEGNSVVYDVRRSKVSYEVHTCLSAHAFQVDIPPGDYELSVERGKEYFPASQKFTIRSGEPKRVRIALQRWTDMAAAGWYSGETHVHRQPADMPTLQLAEDLNVAFPLTAWVTDTEQTPAENSKTQGAVPPAELFQIDATHVYWPVNTEYEIFSVAGQRHTLGAIFVLNHHQPLALAAPPVRPIADEARRQGAFLELDKHNWPWSMMLVPEMQVDLFELTNNHLWRTEFLFADWYPEYVSPYMRVEMQDGKFTELGWVHFGFETYYALLNCGFKMQPTAGTASGVHPVPLGFGRVYVQLANGFNYDAWVKGLLAGDSFVTTGPMLVTQAKAVDKQQVQVSGYLESVTEPLAIELVVNGHAQPLDVQPHRTAVGAYRVPIDSRLEIAGSSWVAVRAFTKHGTDRMRFAHTAPVYFEVADQPLRPSPQQRDYLIQRVSDEIRRNRGVLSATALAEYEAALRTFEAIPAESTR